MGGRIPQTFIDSLIDKADIVQVIDQRVPLKKQGREFAACCPFHNEKTPSFTVSPQKQFYHCFGCGAHGTVIGFLMEYDNLGFVEAVESLAESLGLEVPYEKGASPTPQVDHGPLYDVLEAAARHFRQQLRDSTAAIDYLKQRGLSGEIARKFRLGYAPGGWDGLMSALSGRFPIPNLLKAGLLSQNDQGRTYDKFRDRIMFPILDQRGRVIAFGGRIIGEGEPKYLNSPETPVFNKSATLYGLYEARHAGTRLEQLIVVEGYMDVVALAQSGISNAVATLGTATTAEHLRMMLKGGVRELIFCFDGDQAGKKAAWKALKQALAVIREGHTIRFMFLPQQDDPDSFVRREGADAFREAVSTAQPLSQYLLETLKARHNIATLEGRASLNQEAVELLAPLRANLLREQIEASLATLTHLRRSGGHKAPIAHRPAKTHNLQMTPMRAVIAGLLQHPRLAARLDAPDLDMLRALPGGALLETLTTLIGEQPDSPPARLLERFRGSEHENVISQLLTWKPPGMEEEGWEALFDDALRQLKSQSRQTRLDELLHQSAIRELSVDEKAELKNLLASKSCQGQ